MRLGVFGGTFDPVHVGHLILAEQCREQAKLDQVLFLPAARPPHKLDQVQTPFHHRAEMLDLAIAGNPAFRVDRLEEARPGPSFTAITLAEIQARDSGAELFLLVGSDTLVDVPRWYQPMRIIELATLLVVARAGTQIPPAEELQATLGLPADRPLRCQQVWMPLVEISSSDLRRRVAEGRSIRYQVPRSVEAYIHDKGLYRS